MAVDGTVAKRVDQSRLAEHRFAGCRIFCCTGNADFQSSLTEEVLKELKTICTEFGIPYRYMDLPAALDSAPSVIQGV